jgi:hypothetical protein
LRNLAKIAANSDHNIDPPVALLSGNCFCHPNWYGPKCDLFCPFGYVNGVCYNEPMSNETACSCPGSMYECDPQLGCVCNEDKNCQGGQQVTTVWDPGPGANPTITSYNARVVKIYNATNSIVHIYSKNEIKQVFKPTGKIRTYVHIATVGTYIGWYISIESP